jgi:6-phospho-3-hexuloisomerase
MGNVEQARLAQKVHCDSDSMDAVIQQVLSELQACVSQVCVESLAQALALIESAPRIFVAGAGRSGLCMRAFGMRLMHLGKTVYVVGETTTPGIVAKNLLILGSGSGRTASLLAMARQARSCDAKVLLFTAAASSPMAELADQLVLIPAPSLGLNEGERDHPSIQPMGTLFEQSLLILCDSLILGLMRQSRVSAAYMLGRHANLE